MVGRDWAEQHIHECIVGSPRRFWPALNLGLHAIKPALTGNSKEDYQDFDNPETGATLTQRHGLAPELGGRVRVCVRGRGAWLYSRNPSRLVRLVQLCLYDRSAKLIDEGLGRFQIGKAPTIINFAYSSFRDCTASVSRLNVSRLVKIYNPAAQSDV